MLTWARLHAQDDGGFHVVVRSTLPEWAVADAGAPAEVWLDMRSGSGSEELAYDVIWVNKTATRLPEVRRRPFPMLEPFLQPWRHGHAREQAGWAARLCQLLHCKALRSA